MSHGRRAKPAHLHAKLLNIRQRLGLSQSQMAATLGLKAITARICEFEQGRREPNLIVLLRYARAGDVAVEDLIDDALSLPKLRNK